MSCGVGRRHGLDLVLLWLWYGLVATAAIGLLAWGLPYAAGAALKSPPQKKASNGWSFFFFFFFLAAISLVLTLLLPFLIKNSVVTLVPHDILR